MVSALSRKGNNQQMPMLSNQNLQKAKKKLLRELMTAVLSRGSKMCSFIEMQGLKLVYKRYASLYFCCAIGKSNCEDNFVKVFLQRKETMSCWPLRSFTTMLSCWISILEAFVNLTSSTIMKRFQQLKFNVEMELKCFNFRLISSLMNI